MTLTKNFVMDIDMSIHTYVIVWMSAVQSSTSITLTNLTFCDWTRSRTTQSWFAMRDMQLYAVSSNSKVLL